VKCFNRKKKCFVVEDPVHFQIVHEVLSTVNVQFSTNGIGLQMGITPHLALHRNKKTVTYINFDKYYSYNK
jgi:hypothetical protein